MSESGIFLGEIFVVDVDVGDVVLWCECCDGVYGVGDLCGGIGGVVLIDVVIRVISIYVLVGVFEVYWNFNIWICLCKGLCRCCVEVGVLVIWEFFICSVFWGVCVDCKC